MSVVQVPDDNIIPTREKKRKTKHMTDDAFVNGESIGVTVADNSVESNKDVRKRKKRDKLEEKEKEIDLERISRKEEKKRKRESNEKEEEVGEKSAVNDKKKKIRTDKKRDKLDGNDESLRVNGSGEPSSNDEKNPNLQSDEERNTKVYVEGCTDMDSGCSEKKKKKKKKKKSKHAIDGSREMLDKLVVEKDMAVDSNGDTSGSVKEKKKKKEKSNKTRSKKAKSVKDAKEKNANEGETRKENREESAGCSGTPLPKKPSKKVKFSGEVEIFPISDGGNVEKDNEEEGLVRGKRFSKDEDQILQDAVLKYIKDHDLGDDGITKVMRCRNYPETRNCWKEISPVMPWRTLNSIYNRAHILYERAEKREWTSEEKEDIKKYFKEHGPDWRKYADEHGKSRIHVKDTWRRINVPNKKDGPWSQDEYQNYFNLVNMDLRMKVFDEKKSKHGMLRDDIAWEAISQKLSTRSNTECCRKWYNQLASPLVQKKIWSDLDDYRLLNELASRDFSSVEEVDWDNLLDHRPGDICRKRWCQMVNHLGEHGNKAFADQLEVLLSRYCLDVHDAREIYQKKIPVD